MEIYFYESQKGGIYFSDYEYEYEELRCEETKKYDWFIGSADTPEDALALLRDLIKVDNEGKYELETVLNDMKEYFSSVPEAEEAIRIIRRERKMLQMLSMW